MIDLERIICSSRLTAEPAARYYRWKKNEWGATAETLRDYEAILAKLALDHADTPTSSYLTSSLPWAPSGCGSDFLRRTGNLKLAQNSPDMPTSASRPTSTRTWTRPTSRPRSLKALNEGQT
jgi:hypothetical protein